MARKKTLTVRLNVKAQLSSRLREVRQELYGEHGGPELARRLNLPARTWYNYETGVTVPAEVLLGFIDQTGANPVWLLSGDGPKYRRGVEDLVLADLTPQQLIRRGLEKLERSPSEVVFVTPENLPTDCASDFIAVDLVPLDYLLRPADPGPEPPPNEGHILAYRQWIPHPAETVAVRLRDEAMTPILPSGSVVAVDRAVRDPESLQGKLVAASSEGQVLIRWLEISGKHIILRANKMHRDHPLLPLDLERVREHLLGQVVWSWSRFSGN